jgi:hypothetical protein
MNQYSSVDLGRSLGKVACLERATVSFRHDIWGCVSPLYAPGVRKYSPRPANTGLWESISLEEASASISTSLTASNKES